MPQIQYVNPWVVAAQAVDAEKQRRAAEERQAALDAEKVRQFNAVNEISQGQLGVARGQLQNQQDAQSRLDAQFAATQAADARKQQWIQQFLGGGGAEVDGQGQQQVQPTSMQPVLRPLTGQPATPAGQPQPVRGLTMMPNFGQAPQSDVASAQPSAQQGPRPMTGPMRRIAGVDVPQKSLVEAGLRMAGVPVNFPNDPAAKQPSGFQRDWARVNGKDVPVGYNPDDNQYYAPGSKTPIPADQIRHIPSASETAAANVFTPDPDQVDTFARQIVEHRMAPSQLNSMLGGFGKDGQTIKRAVLARAIEIAPSFNFQEAESNFAFGKNTGTQTTVKMIDNIQKSMPILEKLVAEMDLGGIRIINKAAIAAKSQFGQEGAASFELARNIIADEFAKILQSGGSGSGTSDAKMRQALDIMGGDMSPQQWKGVLGTAREMLGTRRDTLTAGTYMENTGSNTSKPKRKVVFGPDGKLTVGQ